MGVEESEDSRGVVLVGFATPHPVDDLRCTDRVVHNGIAVSRCILPANQGGMVGSSQFTIAVHEDEPLEMEWRLPSAS